MFPERAFRPPISMKEDRAMTGFYLDFPPTKGNPRNSEGGFLQPDEKTILFAYSRYSGECAHDYATADIALMRSRDGGKSWEDAGFITRCADLGAMNVMSVSLLRMGNGDIAVFYLVRISWEEMYCVLRRSADGGASWSAPVRCMPRKGYFVINNDRVTRLSSGRILIPAAEHPNWFDSQGNLHFMPSDAVFFYSDDDGVTWKESGARVSVDAPVCASGLQEPGVVELKDGTLWGWGRTDLGRQAEFRSQDGGLTWTRAQPSRFTSPCSPLSMNRLTDGRLMAVWNPVPHHNITVLNRATGNRTPLVYALSGDDGKTWSDAAVIEDDPDSGYCYTAILPLGGDVLLAYCAGSAADFDSCLSRLRIRRMEVAGKRKEATGSRE